MGSRANYRRLDVYDLRRQQLGEFDVVLLLGVLYHLKHWCGPTVSQVLAWVRAAGFAGATVLKVTDTTVRVRADRRWRGLSSSSEPAIMLQGVPHRPQAVAGGQVNVQLRPLFDGGEHRVAVEHRVARSAARAFVLKGRAAPIKGFEGIG